MGINAEIIADSTASGHRITSFILTIPQIVVKELLRHRMFSFSSSSMRAIPFKGVLSMLKDDTFVPLAWQKDHVGMQGSEYFTDPTMIEILNKQWMDSRDETILRATILNQSGATKQLCNRLLEPFGYAKILVTATEWDNFFNLRLPYYDIAWWPKDRSPEALEPTMSGFRSKKDAIKRTEGECDDWTDATWRESNLSGAEIHIQALAECMWDAYNESTPKELKSGEWHIPFGENIDETKLFLAANEIEKNFKPHGLTYDKNQYKIMVAVARCARLSYANYNEDINYVKDLKLYERLLDDGHMSPFEHCLVAMSDEEIKMFVKTFLRLVDGEWKNVIEQGWCNNFRGWISHRYLVEK